MSEGDHTIFGHTPGEWTPRKRPEPSYNEQRIRAQERVRVAEFQAKGREAERTAMFATYKYFATALHEHHGAKLDFNERNLIAAILAVGTTIAGAIPPE